MYSGEQLKSGASNAKQRQNRKESGIICIFISDVVPNENSPQASTEARLQTSLPNSVQAVWRRPSGTIGALRFGPMGLWAGGSAEQL